MKSPRGQLLKLFVKGTHRRPIDFPDKGNFGTTGGTGSCCYDDSRYQQWQIDDFLLSMILALQDMHMLHTNFIVSWNREENRHE